MFCSFEREPRILRLYGTGRIVLPCASEWQELADRFPATGYGSNQASRRAIIVVDLDRVADSCGYAVPEMELAQERDLLVRSDEKKSAGQLDAYRAEKNAVSIDGLPALGARRATGAADLSAVGLAAAEPARRGSGTGLA